MKKLVLPLPCLRITGCSGKKQVSQLLLTIVRDLSAYICPNVLKECCGMCKELVGLITQCTEFLDLHFYQISQSYIVYDI